MSDSVRGVVREELTVRVRAPLSVVWQEIETIDRILAHTEMVVQSVVDDRRVSAEIRARLRWGPFGWTLNGTATVTEAVAPERLVFTVDIPTMGMRQTGTFELTELSAEETTLRHTSEFVLGRLGRSVKSVVDDEIETYVRVIVDGIAGRAARAWLAEQRLQNRHPIADKQ